jgi:lysophospholipid acyltransferase (LPLAT)-like uncharacterized protein
MFRLSRHNHLVVTPDGPRGPRRQVQAGVIYLAAKTGLPIIAMGIGYQNPWRLRSWDGFVLPRPWRRATMVTATPIPVPPELNPDLLEQYRRLVENTLREVSEAAERWAEEGGRWRSISSENVQTERTSADYHGCTEKDRSSAAP